MITPQQSCVQIDGSDVDPSAVGASHQVGVEARHRIVIRISARVLLHELQECDVDVSERTLRDFLVSDARDERGRLAYLTIARATSPLIQPSGLCWDWIESSDVQLQDGVVTFFGRAVQL